MGKPRKWLVAEDGDGAVCPCCGADFCIMTNETDRFLYCPGCGAKLDGDGEASRPIADFLSFLRETEQTCRMAQADEQEANGEIQDLLHSLELQEHDDEGLLKLACELKKARKRRREAKDASCVTMPVLSWAEDNRRIVRGLEQLLGQVRKAEKYVSGERHYTPRMKAGKDG